MVGGTATTGAQVSAEYFDPLQHAFVPIYLPAVFASASTLQGSALATMPDGRVALFAAGTGAYALFDPVTQQFGKPRVFEPRWQFAAVAVDPTGALPWLAVADRRAKVHVPATRRHGYYSSMSAPTTWTCWVILPWITSAPTLCLSQRLQLAARRCWWLAASRCKVYRAWRPSAWTLRPGPW